MLDVPPRTIDCVVGARPNFVKMAPIMRALRSRPDISPRLIHTGQHYDSSMNTIFFEELAIPQPDIDLEIGACSGATQTARIMLALEPVFNERRPDLVLVVGDVNSTLAAAIVASKLRIPIAHVEAGLRSHDFSMPEEVNRILTDRLSDILFVTEHVAIENLLREGVAPRRIVFVGNVMIDSLYECLQRAIPARATLLENGAGSEGAAESVAKRFAVVTLHRPSNVDDPIRLEAVVKALAAISQKIPLLFPLHPRTKAMIERTGLEQLFRDSNVLTTPPLSYLRMIGLLREARFVITDSGGVQEETTVLGTTCLTLRDNTERPVTIGHGTNVLVGSSLESLVSVVDEVVDQGGKRGRIPPLWDGKAAERIVTELEGYFISRPVAMMAS
jgi:UDP-N-acetylglucosamine 2-epimerase (non-hydrolysing)